MRAPLTDVSVRALKPTEKQYRVWDEKTPGFGVSVSFKSKSWIVMYGVRRTLKVLGRYPDLSLADARRKALVYLGTQPETTTAPRFSEAMEEFIEQHYADKRPRVKSEAQRLLKRFEPALGIKVLTTVTDGDISRELSKLSKTPSEQLHSFRAVRVFLRWCVRPPRRYIRHSPLEGYQAPSQDRKGKRVLTDAELAKIWQTAAEHPHGSKIQLLILWGTRNGETARIERTWLEGGVLTIPGEVTKNHRDHAIPLLPMARDVLAMQLNNSRYYFPGRHDMETHFQDGSWTKIKKEIAKASGVSGWQLRDIRRTFRSNLPKIGVSREIAERLLNHVTGLKNELDEIYDRYEYVEEKREALRRWEAKLASILPLRAVA